MKIIKILTTKTLTTLLLSILSGYALAKTDDIGTYLMRINAIGLPKAITDNSQQESQEPEDIGTNSEENYANLWVRMRKNFSIPDVSPSAIRNFEQYYAGREEYFDRTVGRSAPYLYHILSEVDKRHMPGEIALLPFIESSFDVKAKSHAGATGMWQFMARTGKNFGLKQNSWYDGRNDVYAATDAALDYLQTLHGIFHDWTLALAAYNCGEACVQRAISQAQRNGLTPEFDNLNLPKETRNYVPKLLAVRNLINTPSQFGLDLHKLVNKPYFEPVDISHPIDISAIARLAGITKEKVLALNAGYKIPVWIPKKDRKLLLPVGSAEIFRKNLAKANPNTLISWKVYRTKKKDTLYSIAKQNGMTVKDLARVNNLRISRAYISPGKVLLVNRPVASKYSEVAKNLPSIEEDLLTANPQPITYEVTRQVYSTVKVKRGMSLGGIARRYGMSLSEIRKLNHLKNNHIRIGQTIKVKTRSVKVSHVVASTNSSRSAKSSKNTPRITRKSTSKSSRSRTSSYRVKGGDTLSTIASRSGVSVSQLKKANHITKNHIRKGQVLVIPKH